MRNAGGALPARHILGNYELFEELGRGGMGIVYRALDLSLDRVVAVKILRDDLRSHPSIVARFSREAQAAARLDHENIVQIFSVGAVDRTPYIAMEFIDAVPLSALMQREHRLDWRHALEIGKQIANALACAHDSHVIHRDVKPPNILIDDRRHAYVTDFGIAKILTVDDNLTVDGTRLGTPHYMAPERCKNGDVTAASDLYSLGVLMFQMLTGRLPYEASTPVEMIQRIISEPPARARTYVRDIPEDVERLVAWLMEMNPKHRPASGHVVSGAIDRVLAGKPLDTSTTRPVESIEEFRKSLASSAKKQAASKPESAARWSARRITWIACAAAAAVVAGVGFWQLFAPEPGLTVPAADVSDWFTPSRLAMFNREGSNVHLAEIQLPGYDLAAIYCAGGDGAAAVMLEETGGARKQVLCIVSPSYQDARIKLVAEGEQRMQLAAVAAVMPGSLFEGYSLVRSETESAVLALRSARQLEPASVLPYAIDVADMHPAAAKCVAVVARDGQFMLSEIAWQKESSVEIPLTPLGARIARVQYSPDGNVIAYLRETGAGTYALRVIPATGVIEEPAPIMTGPIALSSNAFNADASAVLVSNEGESTITAIACDSGKQVVHLGAGLRGAWNVAKNSIVFTAPDKDGNAQLWQARADAPSQRTQLTYLDAGTTRDVSVTRNGEWAISGAANAQQPSVVFVQLAR